MISREMKIRAAFRFAPSQWEMPLLCNDVSHWLGASLKLALKIIISFIYSDSDYLKIAHEKWWTSKHGSFLKYHFGQTGTRLVGYFWQRYQGIWVTSQFKCHFLLTTIPHNLHKLQNFVQKLTAIKYIDTWNLQVTNQYSWCQTICLEWYIAFAYLKPNRIKDMWRKHEIFYQMLWKLSYKKCFFKSNPFYQSETGFLKGKLATS